MSNRLPSTRLWERPIIEEEDATPISFIEGLAPPRPYQSSSRKNSIIASEDSRRESFSRRTSISGRQSRNASKTKRRSSFKRQRGSVDIIEDSVANVDKPRFGAFLSSEAQYAVFKGYEDRLRANLASHFPDCTNQLRRTKSPKRNSRLEIRRHSYDAAMHNYGMSPASSHQGLDTLDSTTDHLSPSPRQVHVVPRIVEETKSSERRAISSMGGLLRDVDTGMNTPKHYQHFQNEFAQIQISKRLTIAQSLLDYLAKSKQNDVVVTSSVCVTNHYEGDFNVIQGYNWWSESWSSEFDIHSAT